MSLLDDPWLIFDFENVVLIIEIDSKWKTNFLSTGMLKTCGLNWIMDYNVYVQTSIIVLIWVS